MRILPLDHTADNVSKARRMVCNNNDNNNNDNNNNDNNNNDNNKNDNNNNFKS